GGMEGSDRLGMPNSRSGEARWAPSTRTSGFLLKAPRAIIEKTRRLVCDPKARPRVLDLFSGCGGLSLGFQAAGCDIVAAIEIDELAARSHAVNFCKGQPVDVVDHHARVRDITKIDPEELVDDFGLETPEKAIDVIVGGPPCQAYARVGRAKLREI